MKYLAPSILACLVFATAARADSISELSLNLNSVTVQATSDASGLTAAPFSGTEHTGWLSFASDTNSMNYADIDGNEVGTYGFGQWTLDGQVYLDQGTVQAGHLEVMVGSDRYEFNLDAGTGEVTKLGKRFQFSGLTSGGAFSGDSFGGIDVSRWNAQEPLAGAFVTFKFSPNSAGRDENASLNLVSYAVVPLPPAVLAGAGLLALVGASKTYLGRRSGRLVGC